MFGWARDMTLEFSYRGNSAHIVFGAGVSAQIGEWVERLGHKRALVLSTPRQTVLAKTVADSLGPRAVGIFAAFFHALSQFPFIEAYPFWTIATIGLDVVVIMGLLVFAPQEEEAAT